jgi:predicted HicB family RNase H-like nuclease
LISTCDIMPGRQTPANLLRYKGYMGSVRFIEDKEFFYGKLEFINDLITFQGTSVKELKEDFQKAVDEYIEDCKELGKGQEKPFKGKFPARINPELHKKAAFIALQKNISLNKYVEIAIERAVELDSQH